MISAILSLGIMALAFGLLLGYAAVRFRVDADPLVEKIDALLPQTQCGQCGYPGCKPYAEAVAQGSADVNHCVPGGQTTMRSIADLLGVEPKDLAQEPKPPSVAVIDENRCIGCTLCIQACPVDAIVGAAKQMHTVLARECTGCELCLEPCPVDCITLEVSPETLTDWRWGNPQQTRSYPVIPLRKVS
ncbi:electron transport complex subunit RsxB [Thermithiobacillus plumbiphilus]|uniref:Ion-translocating oxidoreductase complex subunit B n=1 Tax=Thermithiobacillus plumbiphilus TaxID=1729899 RepID=A0ABU9D3V4_9PROT